MSELKIITNNVPRDIIDGYELTPKERKEFDYIPWDLVDKGEESSPSFFRYKGDVYDLGDCERSSIEGWDGMYSQTFFSGVLVRYYNTDFEQVIVGRYYS